MHTVLIPVDGSPQAEAAVRSVIVQAKHERLDMIHLLSVQMPLSSYVSRFLSAQVIRDFRQERGGQMLAGARRLLDNAGLPYTAHIRIGEPAGTICRVAEELRVDGIVLGVEGRGFLSNLMLWLLASRVRRYARVPVIVVMNPEPAPTLALPFGVLSSRA